MFKWAKRKGIADSADSHRLRQPQRDKGIGSKWTISFFRHRLTQRGFASLSRNQKVRPARKSRNILTIKRLCSVTAKNTHKKQEVEVL